MNKSSGCGLLIGGAVVVIIGILMMSSIGEFLLDAAGIIVIALGAILLVVGVLQIVMGRGDGDRF